VQENVSVLELKRFNFNDLYYFNESGERVIISAHDELKMLEQFKADYVRSNPSFVDFVYIIIGVRSESKEKIEADVKLAIQTQKEFPDFIRAYDLVVEEDQGHSILYHRKALIDGFNYIDSESNGSFSYIFHSVETNWPIDLMAPQIGDDSSAAENIYDAIVFKSKRIGHGLGLIKHPLLYPYFIR
jgi:hypothetical protein